MPGQVVELLQDSGVAAISIHGRTMEQRYKRVADWDLISTAARSSSIPVVGNGDILTHYEVTPSGCTPRIPSLLLSSPAFEHCSVCDQHGLKRAEALARATALWINSLTDW